MKNSKKPLECDPDDGLCLPCPPNQICDPYPDNEAPEEYYDPSSISMDTLLQTLSEVWFDKLHRLLEEHGYAIECKYDPLTYTVTNKDGKWFILDQTLYHKLYGLSKKGIVFKKLAVKIIEDEFAQRDNSSSQS
jgi:hypothetical protein